jgi:hypothetical protein
MKAVGTHIESASSLFLIARRVADGGASSFPFEFVSDRSTRGGWRRVEFPIGLSCDTLGEKFRGKGATDWGNVDVG